MEALMVGLQSLKGEWDIALFEDLQEDCALIPLIQAEMGDRVDIEDGINITFAKLPDSWDGFLATCSQRRRWKLRRGRKKLAEHTPYRFILVTTQDELDVYYPELVRLHRDRWKESPGQGGFSTTNYVEFHRAVTKEMLKQGALRLMFLLDGEDTPIAANYCYCWRGAYYGFQMGFALDYQHLRVGEVLMCHAIEQAIDEGMEIFDMLRGDHDYKQWLTNGARQRMNVLVHQPTMRTMTYKALRAGFRQAKRLTAGGGVPEAKPEAASGPDEKDEQAAKPAA
jgi:CelD/BcsL family acetyltransferase involved in cellulose biosynthesis